MKKESKTYKCLKTLKMQGGLVTFTKGNVYKFNRFYEGELSLIDNQGDEHELGTGDDSWEKHFKLKSINLKTLTKPKLITEVKRLQKRNALLSENMTITYEDLGKKTQELKELKSKKPERLIDKVTTNNLGVAFRMCNMHISQTTTDKMIDLVELIETKGDDTSIKDVSELIEGWKPKF